MIKYKIKDVAADFGMSSKEIMQLVEKFFEKPKSNSQVLEDDQLNVLFDYITQTNQIESLEVVFAVQPAPKKEAAPAVVEAAPAPVVEAPTAPGSAGHLKLHNVEPKTAAMVMAIVADKLQKPINELRFISIKEVE